MQHLDAYIEQVAMAQHELHCMMMATYAVAFWTGNVMKTNIIKT